MKWGMVVGMAAAMAIVGTDAWADSGADEAGDDERPIAVGISGITGVTLTTPLDEHEYDTNVFGGFASGSGGFAVRLRPNPDFDFISYELDLAVEMYGGTSSEGISLFERVVSLGPALVFGKHGTVTCTYGPRFDWWTSDLFAAANNPAAPFHLRESTTSLGFSMPLLVEYFLTDDVSLHGEFTMRARFNLSDTAEVVDVETGTRGVGMLYVPSLRIGITGWL